MKVLMINGSPHAKGCTYTALSEVAKELNAKGIETEIIQVGHQAIRGCIGCGQCAGKGLCVFNDDPVNETIKKMSHADGLVVGSPVHYAAAGGAITSCLDRMFYAGGKTMALKPGAAVASARRAGTTATLDQLNKYFTISQMPLVPSQYWNMVHGSCPEDVEKDLEGMQTMRVLGRNMAWMLQCIEAGKQAGVPMPEAEEQRQRTNFIR